VCDRFLSTTFRDRSIKFTAGPRLADGRKERFQICFERPGNTMTWRASAALSVDVRNMASCPATNSSTSARITARVHSAWRRSRTGAKSNSRATYHDSNILSSKLLRRTLGTIPSLANRRPVTLISSTAQAPAAIVIKSTGCRHPRAGAVAAIEAAYNDGTPVDLCLTTWPLPNCLGGESRIYFACSFPASG
jgi:hypothetical protein